MDNKQHHLPSNTCALAGDSLILHPTPEARPSESLITYRIPASWPGDSLIGRRYGGGVGNRCRWADRFAMSEQRQFSEQAFPAESGTLPHRPWAPMPLVNGRGPASEALREGWSEAEVCAEKLPLRGGLCTECPAGSRCGSIWK